METQLKLFVSESWPSIWRKYRVAIKSGIIDNVKCYIILLQFEDVLDERRTRWVDTAEWTRVQVISTDSRAFQCVSSRKSCRLSSQWGNRFKNSRIQAGCWTLCTDVNPFVASYETQGYSVLIRTGTNTLVLIPPTSGGWQAETTPPGVNTAAIGAWTQDPRIPSQPPQQQLKFISSAFHFNGHNIQCK